MIHAHFGQIYGSFSDIYKKFIRNFYKKSMQNKKGSVEFHPRRLYHSKSRQSPSPYKDQNRSKKPNTPTKTNKLKLVIKQPIKKRVQLSSEVFQKTLLSIPKEKFVGQPNILNAANYSNCSFNTPLQVLSNSNFKDLEAKIDKQSQAIYSYFQQLKTHFKLPQLNPCKERVTENQNQTQSTFQELTPFHTYSQKNFVQQLVFQNQKESQILRKQNLYLQRQCFQLHQQLNDLQKIVDQCMLEKSLAEAMNRQSVPKYEASQGSFEYKETNIFQSEKQIKFQQKLIHNLNSEIQKLKAQKHLLDSQIKTLNCYLSQKDSQITKLKEQIQGPKQKNDELHISSKNGQSSNFSICKEVSIFQGSFKNQQQLMEKQNRYLQIQQSNKIVRKSKKSKTFAPQRQMRAQMPHRNPKKSQFFASSTTKRCSIEQDALSQFIGQVFEISHDEISKKQQNSSSKKSSNSSCKHNNAEIDKKKLNFAKTMIKFGSKSRVFQQKQPRKERIQFSNFGKQKLSKLQTIRKTIGARCKVMGFQFQEIQTEFFEKKCWKINQKETAQYLQMCPFFLNLQLIEQMLRFIFQKEYKKQEKTDIWPHIETDIFCNILRQFIPDYAPIDQIQSVIMGQNIKFIVEQRSTDLLEQLRRQQIEAGLVRQVPMRKVLSNFKFTQAQIELIIGQCCIISMDIEHLKYFQYLSYFE